MGRPKDGRDRCGKVRYDASKDTGKPGALPWYLVFVEDGKRQKESYPTQAAAAKAKAGYERGLEAAQNITVEQAIALYIQAILTDVKSNRQGSKETTRYRLLLYYKPVLKLPFGDLTPELCRKLRAGEYRAVPGSNKPKLIFEGLAQRELPRTKRVATATSQLEIIDAARTFTRRMVAAGHLASDPMSWFDPSMEAERDKGGKGQSDLSFSQAEKVLKFALELAQAEAGKTEIGTRAAAVFLVLMTGPRASTVAGLTVGSIDRRRGEAAGERWILRAPRAKKRGKTQMRSYGLPAIFETVLGPLCEGRAAHEPLFAVSRPRYSAPEKMALAAQYTALGQSKSRAATAARRAFLGKVGSWRQQMNRWQRGDFGETAKDGPERSSRGHGRDWVRKSVGKICVLAGVPVETAHALRGALASQLASEGYAGVAQWLLDHVRLSTTEGSYASAEAIDLGKMKPFLGILEGGKR